MQLKTQNSNILVKGYKNIGFIGYFGMLIDIIELGYSRKNSIMLFTCDWFNVYHEGRQIAQKINMDLSW